MESMPSRTSPSESFMGDSPMNSQQSFDLVKVLWRWKWLPILGAIIGSGVGYMYFTKLPQQYQSAALIQVVSPVPVMTRNELAYDGSKVGSWSSSSDESRAIRSRTVLGLAVKAGNLEKHFPGLTAEDIVWKLAGGGGVDVQPADKSASATQQLIISYTCTNPEVSRYVVDAVVEGYETFLAQEYETVDTEVLNYFATQKKELDKRYDEAQAKLEQLKKDFPNVLWKVDEPNDPYSTNYERRFMEAERLKEQATALRNSITTVEDARKKGRNPEDLLMFLHDGSDTFWKQMLGDSGGIKETELESERLKRTQLLELKALESQLQKTQGPNHPSLLQVQAKIEVVNSLIKTAEEYEAKNKEKEQTQRAALAKQEISRGPDYLLQVTVNSLMEKYRSIVKMEEEIRKLAEEDLKKSHEFQTVVGEYHFIAERLASAKEMSKGITGKLDTLELAPKNMNQRELRELNPASPGYAYGPFPSKYLLGGAAVGVLIMSCLAVLMDLADRSYRSPEEIVSDLGIPVLGHIPAMDPKKLKKSMENIDPTVVTLHHGRGRVAESYRSIRTALFFSNRGADLKVVQITSPVPGDGKSTLSANLAVALAQSGRKVLLIDADFRRPRIEKIFGLDKEVGMVQLVAGKAEMDEALCKSPVANLTILPGGKRPSNPAELLSSARFAQLIELLREKFDLIIIDTPPVLAVSDPSVVASCVDGVVVTMRLRRNIKPLATRTLNTLEAVDAPLIGIVVNGVSAEAAYGGYGYNYGYNDYRYSYRYSENNYSYGKYREYSAGYVDDDHSNTEPDNANSAT